MSFDKISIKYNKFKHMLKLHTHKLTQLHKIFIKTLIKKCLMFFIFLLINLGSLILDIVNCFIIIVDYIIFIQS